MGELNKIKKSIAAIAPSVKVDVDKNCIVLSGELDNWDDIVACGHSAVSKKYLGVINNIKLKNYEQKIRLPKINDNLYDGAKPDVLIIGGGISGTTIARALSKWKLNVMLVEKGYDVALGATSRNDGCVHVGIDLMPNQLKHKYLIKGNAMYGDMCKDLDVKFERTGHMLLLYHNWEKRLLPFIKTWAKILKIPGVRLLSREELLEIEPNVVDWAKGAFLMPSGGLVSPYKLTVALAEASAENGVKICLNTAVSDMKVENGIIKEVKTNRGVIYPRLVINASGTYADIIAEMAGDRTFTIHPRKGIVIILDKKKNTLARTSLAKLPFIKVPENWQELSSDKSKNKNNSATDVKLGDIDEPHKTHTKGGGVMHTVDNNILMGPNAIEVPDREDFTSDMNSIKEIFDKQKIIQDKINMSDVITYFAGERPATYEEDYVVRKGIFTKNIIEVAGIQSPGVTTAPAIAEEVEKWTLEMLGREKKIEKKIDYKPTHKSVPHLAEMSEEERDALIKKNPLYGEIVCRCEEISKGEIIDAINSPVPVYTVDAVKRRVRPGMGRCQGGFCSPTVIKILAEQRGCSVEEITKANDYSVILLDKTKNGANKNV